MNEFAALQEAQFTQLCDALFNALAPGEALAANLAAEDSRFLRFNAGRLRQGTEVQQAQLSLLLQQGGRSLDIACTLSGVPARDRPAVLALLQQARADATLLPPDPYQVALRDEGRSHAQFAGRLPQAGQVVQAIAAQADRLDLAGLYVGGDVLRGHRSSCGSAHWFGTQSFFLDYSLYEGRRAAKGVYAGTHWEPEAWSAQLERTAAELALLRRPAQRVAPGAWRTWLAPQAFAEFIGMLGWHGLSADVWKQGRSPLKRLIEGEVQLSPLLRLDENFQLGLTPRFNSRGETSVERLPLLADGRLQNLLVSASTAREHGLVANGADGNEAPRALDVAPGELAQDQVLQALGTGLYVANLHYLNWSDPASARVTGMTRYACFWVQDGEIAGPLAADLRWDQSLYDALGPQQLLALSRATEIAPATSTYAQRALGGMRTPGALIDRFHYTL